MNEIIHLPLTFRESSNKADFIFNSSKIAIILQSIRNIIITCEHYAVQSAVNNENRKCEVQVTDRIHRNCTWTRKRRIGERKYQADGNVIEGERKRELQKGFYSIGSYRSVVASLAQGATLFRSLYVLFQSFRANPERYHASLGPGRYPRAISPFISLLTWKCLLSGEISPHLSITWGWKLPDARLFIKFFNISMDAKTSRSNDVNFLVRFYDWEHSSLWILMIFLQSTIILMNYLQYYDSTMMEIIGTNSFQIHLLSRQKVYMTLLISKYYVI